MSKVLSSRQLKTLIQKEVKKLRESSGDYMFDVTFMPENDSGYSSTEYDIEDLFSEIKKFLSTVDGPFEISIISNYEID